MDKEIISALFNNAALLLAMCLVYDTLALNRKTGRIPAGDILSGCILGAIGLAVMVNPFPLHQGIIFDTRSILLCTSGLFFGAIPTAIAMAITAVYRLHLGGSGALMGISVIISSGVIGIAWRQRRHGSLAELSFRELFGLGIVVHAVMLVLTFLLPSPLVEETLLKIGIPVMLIYPVATALLGRMMVSRYRNLRAEEALLKSEERFTYAMDATSDGLWDWDIASGCCYFSPGYHRMLGYQPGEFPMVSDSWLNLIHPDDRERAQRVNQDCIENRSQSFETEFRMGAKNGGWRWILGRGKAISRDQNGRALRLVGTHVDITERKVAEEALRESEQRYREVFDNSFDGIFLIEVCEDMKFRIIDINAVEEKMIGIAATEVRGKYLHEIVSAEMAAVLENSYRNCVEAGAPLSYEESVNLKHGTVEFYTTLVPIADANGRINRIVGIAHDITKRKQNEEKVRESEQLYRRLFELESDAIFLLDAENGNIIEANQKAVSLYGYERDELLDMKMINLSEVPEITLYGWAASMSKAPLRLHRKKNGSEFPVEITSSHFSWKGRDVHLAAVRDITERIEAEEERKVLMAQLSQSQKMEAVGQLSGGIAHDFNNILTVIFGYGHILLTKIEENSPLRHPLDQIMLSATRAADLIQRLLAFSRKQVLSTELVDLRSVVKDMEKMLKRLVREDIDFRVTAIDRELTVNADKGQMGQVLINLVTNAVDALPNGGKLAISVDAFTMDEQFIRIHGYGQSGDYAVFTVADNGCGMDEATAKKVYEPFFTTKEVGKGTGLGLSIVYGIINQHNGYIGVESREGAGTTFRIYLPLEKSETVADSGKKQRLPIEVSGTETILLAEDDESVRRTNALAYAESGYRVIQADDGEDALAKFLEYRHVIDLLVFDVIMPKKDGKAVYEEIKGICPEMKVLFMSGYTKDIVITKGVVEEEVFFIAKPFNPYDLLKITREIIDR